jgi:CBS domain-containing protein
MRSPLTGVVFAIELTHQFELVLPLLIAVTVAHGCSVLLLRRSILTEKVARRGYHLSREYAVDPLEILFVREVMRTSIVAIPADASPAQLRHSLHGPHARGGQRLYPVVGPSNELVGVVRRDALQALADGATDDSPAAVMEIAATDPAVAYPDESLRMIVYRMAETGLTRFPVVDRRRRLVGMVGLQDLLKGRALTLEAEQRRERVLGTRIAVLLGRRRAPSPV